MLYEVITVVNGLPAGRPRVLHIAHEVIHKKNLLWRQRQPCSDIVKKRGVAFAFAQVVAVEHMIEMLKEMIP